MSAAELHEQVPIAGQDFTADVGIAPLIEALLTSGFQTTGSCEDGGGSVVIMADDGVREFTPTAWVGFVNREQAERFKALIGDVGAAPMLIEPDPDELAAAKAAGVDDPAVHGAIGVAFAATKTAAILVALEPPA